MKKTTMTLLALLILLTTCLKAQVDKPVSLGWVIKTEPMGLIHNKLVLSVERKITTALSIELKGCIFHHTIKNFPPIDLKGNYVKLGAKIFTEKKAGAPATEAMHGFYIKPEIGFTNFKGTGRITEYDGAYSFYTYGINYEVQNWQVLMSFGSQNFLFKRLAVDTFFGWGIRFEEPEYKVEGEQVTSNMKGGNNFSSFAIRQGVFVISGGVSIGFGL